MAKRTQPTVGLMASLDATSSTPLYRQLYEEIRDAVLTGRLATGARLPSSRTLADDLGVSRNVVLIAFEQLLAEGYLEGKVGAGTYVCRDLPDNHLLPQSTDSRPKPDGERRCLSRRGARSVAASELRHWTRGSPHPFDLWLTAPDAFPVKLWARLVGRHWRQSPLRFLGHGEPAGFRPLREAIAAHLRATRGVQCSADQVLVISNIDRACQLVTSLLLDEGDLVWIEDPGYLIPRFGLLGSGVRQVPVPVDAEGLDLAAAIRRAPRARLACVLPSLHYPLGVTMSLQRRLSLLDWARRADAWILEIDFGCEFRFRGRPLEALQGLDRNNRVIYYGTFRQMLFPGVNLSYLVVPRDLADDFAAARVIVGPQPASVYQAVMADFMAEGHFTRHVRRMRRLYAQKRATFLKAAAQHLDGTLEFQPADGGFHLVGWLPRGMDDVAAADEAARHDVHVTPLSSCAAQPPERGALIMGTGALNVRQIWNGVIRLAAALSKLK